jgi:CrcB protein
MERYLLVMLGGALGSALRYGLSVGMQQWLGSGFPWGTLLVNVLGSYAIGWVMRGFTAGTVSDEVRLLVAVGVLGGFTTFSTFSYETLGLIQRQELGKAVLYVGLSLALSLGAVALAWRNAEALQINP